MTLRPRNRRTTIAVSALAAALSLAASLAAVTPALAGTGPDRTSRPARDAAHAASAPGTPVQGDPRNATQRVADFYGAYIDTVWDGRDPAAGSDAKALKDFYLSAGARKKVAAYEAREHADGILFAQNVPVRWKVDYTGSGAGHATSRVTLIWSDRRNAEVTKIDVRSDLRTRKITDLRPAG
jgi:hypothetical protein